MVVVTGDPGGKNYNFNGASAQALAFNFGSQTNPTAVGVPAGTGSDGVVQYGVPGASGKGSSVTATSQDGYAAGSVSTVNVASDGTINGVFSNGQQRELGRVVVASFADNNGLTRAGSNLYTATPVSGEPLVSGASEGGRGSIQSQALEQSNVDLGTEFVTLIAYQRGFQANSKIVQAADDLYQDLVNIRR